MKDPSNPFCVHLSYLLYAIAHLRMTNVFICLSVVVHMFHHLHGGVGHIMSFKVIVDLAEIGNLRCKNLFCVVCFTVNVASHGLNLCKPCWFNMHLGSQSALTIYL